ncbi:MAG: T9SS type A sorting domain-containing protein [Panacibacter sp.]
MKSIRLQFLFLFAFAAGAGAQSTFNKLITKASGTFTYHSNHNTIPTNSGGYAFAESNGNDAYLGVMDKKFNLLWARNINVQNNHKSSGFSVAQSTADSSYCMIGVTSDPSRPEYDLLVSRIKSNGDLIDTKTYLYGSSSGGFSKILALPSGKFMIGMDNSANSIGLMLMNKKGAITNVQNVTYDGALFLLFADMIATNDGGYMLTGNVGYNYGLGQRDIFCIKLNSSLGIEWSKFYATGNTEEVSGIIQTKDGGYFMFGYYQQSGPDTRSRLIKISKNGNVQWNKVYAFRSNGFPFSAVQNKDRSYTLAGFDVFNVSNTGDFQWSSNYNYTSSTNPIIPTPDKGYVFFSQYNSTSFNIVKTDSVGKTCNGFNQSLFTQLTDSVTVQDKIFTTSNGSIVSISSGSVFNAAPVSSTFLCNNNVITAGEPESANVTQKQLLSFEATAYPNPAKNILILSINHPAADKLNLTITGMEGRIIKTQFIELTAGTNKKLIDVSGFAKGVYILKLTSVSGTYSLKFIKE